MAAKKKPAKKKVAAPKKAKKAAARKPVAKKPSKATKAPAKKKVSPVPRGYATVTATMNQADAAATIAFCQEVFGAKVRTQMPTADGKLMHCELQIGDSVVMISDAIMEPARVASLFLYVPDVDKVYAKALAAGATPIMAPMDQFWGDRFARVIDKFGNHWGLATHVEDLTPAQMKKRSAEAAAAMAQPTSAAPEAPMPVADTAPSTTNGSIDHTDNSW